MADEFADPNPVGKSIQAGETPMQFPNLGKRRLIRARKNPQDRCTVVSILAKQPPTEYKYTIWPGKFDIPKGSVEDPGLLVVGGSSWWNDYDIEKDPLEIPVGSIQLAESIIKDYCNGMIGCNMDDAMPGLFYVEGIKSKLEIKSQYRSSLVRAAEKQREWYKILVRQADSLWARSNGNPLVIMDEMRIAAQELNLNDKPWLKDFKTIEMQPCKFCGFLRNPTYPICPSCKAIDQSHPLAKEVVFAQSVSPSLQILVFRKNLTNKSQWLQRHLSRSLSVFLEMLQVKYQKPLAIMLLHSEKMI